MAETNWLDTFLKGNPSLYVRRPEATSLARAANFSRSNVNIFYDNFSKVLHGKESEAHNVYNANETGADTFQAHKIIAAKAKQVSALRNTQRM
jgi:hypothetical protein